MDQSPSSDMLGQLDLEAGENYPFHTIGSQVKFWEHVRPYMHTFDNIAWDTSIETFRPCLAGCSHCRSSKSMDKVVTTFRPPHP